MKNTHKPKITTQNNTTEQLNGTHGGSKQNSCYCEMNVTERATNTIMPL